MIRERTKQMSNKTKSPAGQIGVCDKKQPAVYFKSKAVCKCYIAFMEIIRLFCDKTGKVRQQKVGLPIEWKQVSEAFWELSTSTNPQAKVSCPKN